MQNAAGPLQDAAADGHHSTPLEPPGIDPKPDIAFFEHHTRLTHLRLLPMFDS